MPEIIDAGDAFHFPIFKDAENWYDVLDGMKKESVHFDEKKEVWTCTCEQATILMSLQRPISCPHIRAVREAVQGETP